MVRVGELIEAWRGSRVLVLGDALLDGWLAGTASRVCREAPLPVVDLAETRYAGGGAANTAANLAALGAVASLVAPVGADGAGTLLRGRLAAAGVADRLVPAPGRRTVAKRRLVAGGQIVARFDEGDTGELPEPVRDALLARTRQALAEGPDAVVVCDYGTGAVPGELLDLVRRRRGRMRLLAVDAHDLGPWATARPDLVTPNLTEAAHLLSEAAPATADPAGAGRALLDGVPLADAALAWRGPLAFLRWRDAAGRRGRLAWWPDTLPPAERRVLKLWSPDGPGMAP